MCVSASWRVHPCPKTTLVSVFFIWSTRFWLWTAPGTPRPPGRPERANKRKTKNRPYGYRCSFYFKDLNQWWVILTRTLQFCCLIGMRSDWKHFLFVRTCGLSLSVECDSVTEPCQRTFALHFEELSTVIVRLGLQLAFMNTYHHLVVIKKYFLFSLCIGSCLKR